MKLPRQKNTKSKIAVFQEEVKRFRRWVLEEYFELDTPTMTALQGPEVDGVLSNPKFLEKIERLARERVHVLESAPKEKRKLIPLYEERGTRRKKLQDARKNVEGLLARLEALFGRVGKLLPDKTHEHFGATMEALKDLAWSITKAERVVVDQIHPKRRKPHYAQDPFESLLPHVDHSWFDLKDSDVNHDLWVNIDGLLRRPLKEVSEMCRYTVISILLAALGKPYRLAWVHPTTIKQYLYVSRRKTRK